MKTEPQPELATLLSGGFATLAKLHYGADEIHALMGVSRVGNSDVFDALIREGFASNFVHAAALVAAALDYEKTPDLEPFAFNVLRQFAKATKLKKTGQ